MTPASRWRWEPERLCEELDQAGWETDLSAARLPDGGGSLSARRDRGARTLLLAIDAGGRIHATLTRTVDEHADTASAAGTTLHLVIETQRTTTVAGTLSRMRAFRELLRFLDALDGGHEAVAVPRPGIGP